MLEELLSVHGLGVVGRFRPSDEDGAPEGTGEVALIGSASSSMWTVFRQSPEYRDDRPDPLDRWSRRVISGIARQTGGHALFPFGGPPWQPFLRWAARGEGAVSSPVAMQVSPTRGLWMSYRGALAYRDPCIVDEHAPGSPCLDCAAPCRNACPVDAFAGGQYDVARCVAHITSPDGRECETGCLARIACPAGTPPPKEQRAFHMKSFIRAHLPARTPESD